MGRSPPNCDVKTSQYDARQQQFLHDTTSAMGITTCAYVKVFSFYDKLVLLLLSISTLFAWIAYTCTGWGELVSGAGTGTHFGLWRICSDKDVAQRCESVNGWAKGKLEFYSFMYKNATTLGKNVLNLNSDIRIAVRFVTESVLFRELHSSYVSY